MRQIKRALASLPLSHFDQHLFWAAFTLAYFGFLCVGELVPDSGSQASASLSHSDVQIGTTEVTLRISSSKTDPFRCGASVRLAATGTSLCSVRAVSDYQAYRPASSPKSAFLLPVRGHTSKMPERGRCAFRPAILSSPSHLFAQIGLSLASVRNPSNAQPVCGHTSKMPERSRCAFRPAILSSQLLYRSRHHCPEKSRSVTLLS